MVTQEMGLFPPQIPGLFGSCAGTGFGGALGRVNGWTG